MKDILNHLFEHKTLSQAEAREVLQNMAQGHYNPAQMAAFMTVYLMRSITVEELEGFREAMLSLCIAIDLSDYNPMDLCGTGGDGKNTFNISTVASFVVAAAGVAVAKHGNYGVSSISGSSSVMEYFGYQFTNDEARLRAMMDDCGLCFLHAPLFHPAMKTVAPIRKELGVKTFFNMLGPMVNPASPRSQMVGVFSLELARLYAYLFQKTDKQFSIVHSLDGYDEISLTDGFKHLSQQGEALITPESLMGVRLQSHDILGGDTVEASADIFAKVLQGKGTSAQNAVVSANAGMAIHCAKPNLPVVEAIQLAHEKLVSGEAWLRFERLMAFNQKSVA